MREKICDLTPAQHARLRYQLKHLIRASIDDAQKGGGPPEDHDLIEHELRSRRAQFWSLFGKQEAK